MTHDAQAATGDGAVKGRSPPPDLRGFDQVREAVASIRFGQVVVIVQDGLIVQIDRTEKVRLR